ncbi:IS630 family transposase [Mucilaginibacter limnophilus]|uniref:IS630 family transposase n=1 Tax=Mucilaginibacter limnophilus TaxID=1932778 RepID=A0A3S2UNK4_9SPHI|nr:IS630 family transposase [Mucilaginibacter limnophilus]
MQESFDGRCLREVADKVEVHLDTVEQWVAIFKLRGIAGLLRKPWTLNDEKQKEVEQKIKNLNALIHQSPSLYGINRTSWRTEDLAAVYSKVYGVVLTRSTVWNYLQRQGYRFRKAKEVLTSPDPKFREKLDKITSILNNLKPDDRFFSIDEMGSCGIRAKVGWSYTEPGEQKTVKAHQKAKAYIICTAALELTTNQVTHFYSRAKNTDEMIKLMEVLIEQYRGMRKIYLSWDAASWHASSKLKERIKEVSARAYRKEHGTPAVELAPLPASAQFLNVIESVFSGLAKAVLHNSDYKGADDCKQAIDRYFSERNAYYLKYPKRAGKRIWGKELVPAKFSPDQNCKDPRVRFNGKKKSQALKKPVNN